MFSFIKEVHKSISGKEKNFVFFLIFLTLLISVIPVIYGWLSTPPNLHYTGFTVIAGADKMVYFSQIEEAMQGHLLFHNLYTSEAAVAKIFSPVWLVLGWLTAITGLSKVFIFHFARILLGAVFLYFIYLFISRFFNKIKWKKVCFFAICLGSGLGVFTLNKPWSAENMYNTFGTDMWVSEGNTFLTLYHSPLFILSQIFILFIFWWLIERLNKTNWLSVIFISFITLFLGIFHPYDLIIIYTVVGCWFLVNCLKQKKISWKQFSKLAVIFVVSSLAILYFLWLKFTDSSFAVWAVQNITLSPRFFNYAVGYGLIFIFYLFGIYKAVKSQNNYWRFLGIWSIVGWFLLFVPLQFQRRLSNGLHLPMVIIAVLGLYLVINYLNKRFFWQEMLKYYSVRAFLVMSLGFLLISSTFYNVGQDIVILSTRPPLYYLKQEEYQAMLWLKNNISKDKVILSSAKTGNIIPAVTANKVYIGHGHQTGDWMFKLFKVKLWFFKTNKGDKEKYEWLKYEGINYIFYGSQERFLESFNPQEKNYLKPVYQNNEVVIYQVI
ncbi:hypothetical protein KKF32_03705 [Patescibacteria group bacterium]|nr:hypothetical protein [Patescibacteria group bacterium]